MTSRLVCQNHRFAIGAIEVPFRAAMMVALSLIHGGILLLIVNGAGAESQKRIGTTVFGGMIAATFLSLAVVPMLYSVVERVGTGGELAFVYLPSKTHSQNFETPLKR